MDARYAKRNIEDCERKIKLLKKRIKKPLPDDDLEWLKDELKAYIEKSKTFSLSETD